MEVETGGVYAKMKKQKLSKEITEQYSREEKSPRRRQVRLQEGSLGEERIKESGKL